MELVFKDSKRRTITKKEDIAFIVKNSGLYAIVISARCKGEKQVGSTNDEDLRIEIDGRRFGKLTNPNRYYDCPASFTGGELHNLKKTIYFLLILGSGRHTLALFADQTATLESLEVLKITTSPDKVTLTQDIAAEDGDRYPWIVFVLVDLTLSSMNLTLTLRQRLIDSDDAKVIIDGKVQRNFYNWFRRFWYFIASKDSNPTQSAIFTPQLVQGLHYIELWADRMPIFHEVTFHGVKLAKQETIEEKIIRKAKEFKLNPNLMLRIARKESTLDPNAVSPVGAKGLFQLTQPAIDEVAKQGFQVDNPFDIDQNITGAMIYFTWLYDIYKGDKEELEKTLAGWNWGIGQFPIKGSLDYKPMPDETKNFIKDILRK